MRAVATSGETDMFCKPWNDGRTDCTLPDGTCYFKKKHACNFWNTDTQQQCASETCARWLHLRREEVADGRGHCGNTRTKREEVVPMGEEMQDMVAAGENEEKEKEQRAQLQPPTAGWKPALRPLGYRGSTTDSDARRC